MAVGKLRHDETAAEIDDFSIRPDARRIAADDPTAMNCRP
jgi:hypothetical protein